MTGKEYIKSDKIQYYFCGLAYRPNWLSLHTSQVAHQAGSYPGFCSMKRLGIFLLFPGWDASPSQGYPQH